jgi:hypothetical protein
MKLLMPFGNLLAVEMVPCIWAGHRLWEYAIAACLPTSALGATLSRYASTVTSVEQVIAFVGEPLQLQKTRQCERPHRRRDAIRASGWSPRDF